MAIVPIAVLGFLSHNAFWEYGEEIEWAALCPSHQIRPFWIGGTAFAVAAGSLAASLILEPILRLRGRKYDVPALSLILAGTWNFVLGLSMFTSGPFECGLWYVSPGKVWVDTLYLTAIVFALLISGIGAIKHDSLQGTSGTIAKLLCFLNASAALSGVVFVFLSGCLFSGPA